MTDPGFLFPTLVSASAMRDFISPDRARIYVFALGLDSAWLDAVGDVCGERDITLCSMSASVLDDLAGADFNKTHVPPSTLARFFMSRFLPDGVDHVLYLDGDTLVRSDPSALVDYRVPAGRIAAAEDVGFFRQHDNTKIGAATRAYFDGLDLDRGAGYFNAGVLAADRPTWDSLCAEALAFFRANAKRCLYHDQSALNAVAGTLRLRLHPGWNFITHYRVWGLEASIQAGIYHFAGGEKPWRGAIEPWKDIGPRYTAFAHAHPRLPVSLQNASAAEIGRINRHAMLRRYGLHLVFRNRLSRYRSTMADLVASASGPWPGRAPRSSRATNPS